jgi:hypothetical protein
MEKLDSSSDQHLQACSTSPKLTKIEQASPIHLDDWTNQQRSSTMITPPPTITPSNSETFNCTCCDYDGQFYNSHYYPSTQQQPTPSQHMTVNLPVVANFQVNVNTTQHGYPLPNSINHQHHHYSSSRKQNLYYQQQQQQQPITSSYYRNGYPTTMKYNQQPTSIYHQQPYSSPSQTFVENNNHFSNHDFVYAHRQHHSIAYNTLNGNHQSNGHIYHQL